MIAYGTERSISGGSRSLPPFPEVAVNLGIGAKDDYTMEEELGVGGFGSVYKATSALDCSWLRRVGVHKSEGKGSTVLFMQVFAGTAQTRCRSATFNATLPVLCVHTLFH